MAIAFPVCLLPPCAVSGVLLLSLVHLCDFGSFVSISFSTTTPLPPPSQTH